MHWINTRKYAVFSLFIVFALVASFCLVTAYITNPYLPKLPASKPSTFQTQIGQRTFPLPSILHAGVPNEVSVWCNVTGFNLAVGNPIYIQVEVEIQNNVYDIILVQATVRNALRCSPIPWENYPLMQPLTPSRFSLYLQSSDRSTFFPFESEVHSGGDIVEFQASGTVELSISITLLPPSYIYADTETYKEYQALFPDGKYNLEVPLDSIIIESGLTAQQQANNNLNLSLTYFVLFFASIDIAVLLYDHSEDKDKSAEYEKYKAEKKHNEIREKGQEVV